MIVIYEGRRAIVANYSSEYAAQGKVCKVVGPESGGKVPVEVQEVGNIWKAYVSPDELLPLSERQAELAERHGTPAEFATACWGALGEVSLDECNAAISKYSKEFHTPVQPPEAAS